MEDSKELLEKLDKLLLHLPDNSLPPLPDARTELFDSYHKVSGRIEELTKIIVEKSTQLLSSGDVPLPFRVCSVGCGDGSVDYYWLSVILKNFPDIQIQYVGVDVDKNACRIAKENLSFLNRVEVKVYHQDITDGLSECPFDLLVSVSNFYYMPSPEHVLQICKDLLIMPTGLMIIILGDRKPNLELFQRFWLRQFQFDVCFSTKLACILDEMNISYSEGTVQYELDVTECFHDDFEKPHQKCILEVFTQVDTFAYSKDVSQVCMDYLHSIAKKKSDTKIYIAWKMSSFTIMCQNR